MSTLRKTQLWSLVAVSLACCLLPACTEPEAQKVSMHPRHPSSEYLKSLGAIQIKEDGVDLLTFDTWIDYGEKLDESVPPPPKYGRNPANGEVIEMKRWPTDRAIMIGDDFLIVYRWRPLRFTPNETGELIVLAHRDHWQEATELAKSCADKMNAELVFDSGP